MVRHEADHFLYFKSKVVFKNRDNELFIFYSLIFENRGIILIKIRKMCIFLSFMVFVIEN